MINRRVLFVDDEQALLDTYKRLLSRRFETDTAKGPDEGLRAIEQNQPYAVIVSDLRMPRMNGIDFLARAKSLAPDSVRVMLTGYVDTDAAVGAVNEGHIFRFLNKPCPHDHMVKTLEAGVEQYRLVMAERELLENTVAGSVRILTEILGLISPEVMGRTSQVRRMMRLLAHKLDLPNVWQYELAGMLSQIGCLILQPKILDKVWSGQTLTPEESALYRSHPKIGSRLLSRLPRLDAVAWMIARQQDGPPTGDPASPEEESLALGGMMLHVSLALDRLLSRGIALPEAVSTLLRASHGYPPRLLNALQSLDLDEKPRTLRHVRVDQLSDGMILAEDVRTRNGMLLLPKEHEVNPVARLRLQSAASGAGITEPIPVWVEEEQRDIPAVA